MHAASLLLQKRRFFQVTSILDLLDADPPRRQKAQLPAKISHRQRLNLDFLAMAQ